MIYKIHNFHGLNRDYINNINLYKFNLLFITNIYNNIKLTINTRTYYIFHR